MGKQDESEGGVKDERKLEEEKAGVKGKQRRNWGEQHRPGLKNNLFTVGCLSDGRPS